eukprot:EG_transcript_11775
MGGNRWQVDLVRCMRNGGIMPLYGTNLVVDSLPDVLHLELDDGQGVILGRGYSDGQVCVDPNPRSVVSKKHATIRVNNGAFLIEDHGSTNGTFVNWKKVARSPLQEGDTVVFGGGANIALGQVMTEMQRQHVQLLEWKFHVVRPAALSSPAAPKDSPRLSFTETPAVAPSPPLTPTSSSHHRRTKRPSVPPPPPPPKPSPKVAAIPLIPQSPAPSPEKQRETFGAPVPLQFAAEAAPESPAKVGTSENHHQDHSAVETQNEEWLIVSDGEDEQEMDKNHQQELQKEEEFKSPLTSEEELLSEAMAQPAADATPPEAAAAPGSPAPRPRETFQTGFQTMDSSLYLLRDNSYESDSPPKAKKPRRLTYGDDDVQPLDEESSSFPSARGLGSAGFQEEPLRPAAEMPPSPETPPERRPAGDEAHGRALPDGGDEDRLEDEDEPLYDVHRQSLSQAPVLP